jgi:hypothetical protein
MASKVLGTPCRRAGVRGGGAGLLIGVIGVVGVPGCAAPFLSRLPDVAISPSRMVVFPVVVKEFELDINADRTMQPETTDLVHDNIAAAVRDQTNPPGAHAFAPQALDGHDPSVRQLYADLWRWMEVASIEIAAQKEGRRDFGRHSVGDWRFHGDLAPLGDALQADTALTVLFRETKGHGEWRGVSAACAVSLHDGRMVWCHDADGPWGNLKDPAVAQAAVHELLADLTASPPVVAK